MLVLYQSYLEREDEVAMTMERWSMSEDEARDEAEGIFEIVRSKVQRFMTRTTHKRNAVPMPMDWIYETQTYGRHIRFNMAAGDSIDWEGNKIKHRRIGFKMGQLSEMWHTLVEGVEGLPAIEWLKMEDDYSEDKVGYSFLQDDRNRWLEKGKGWVLQRILGLNKGRKEWISTEGNAKPYRPEAVRKYSRIVEQFRERLWMIMHMVAGQPARSTEILGIRFVNTVNGGIRNILAHNKMMCFVTSYHKNYRSTGNVKVIHRYLPREIDELLVWYLWLVLLYWQQVQGVIKQADNRSAFLWAD